MARIWNVTREVDEAVATIRRCLEETGTIPEALMRAYWENIQIAQRTRRGLVAHFYERLSAECPEALRWFTEKPIEMDQD